MMGSERIAGSVAAGIPIGSTRRSAQSMVREKAAGSSATRQGERSEGAQSPVGVGAGVVAKGREARSL